MAETETKQEDRKDLLEKVYKGITDTQDRLSKVDGRIDALDKAVIDKIANEVAKSLESIQKQAQAEYAAAKERVDFLEKQVARVGEKTDDKGKKRSAYDEALVRYMRKNEAVSTELIANVAKDYAEHSLVGANETQKQLFVKDLVEGSGPDGGYLVTPDRSSQIIQRIFETSPLRLVASVINSQSEPWEVVLDDTDIDAGWVSEVGTRPATLSPQVSVLSIATHELYASPRATQKMLDDVAFDLESWLVGKITNRISRVENTAFVSGNGSQKPRGMLTYPDWTVAGTYERDKVEQVQTASSGDFSADDLIKLQNTLLEEFQANASFAMQRATFTKVMQLKGTDGQYLLDPRILAQGGTKILLGSNVIFMSDMPAVAANALPIVVADFRQFYTIVDRVGIRLLRDPYTAKPYIVFYTTKRTGGAVTNFQAGKILKIKP